MLDVGFWMRGRVGSSFGGKAQLAKTLPWGFGKAFAKFGYPSAGLCTKSL
jgi:hypothetical protein